MLVAKMAGTPLLIIGAQAGTRSFDRGPLDRGLEWIG
jgi:hypothetical protein